MRREPEPTRPEYRQLRIYAIDPMVARGGDHQVTVQIRWEDLNPEDCAAAGQVRLKGRRVEVVDVDASGETPIWLKPVDLDHKFIASQQGLEPSESDPQFHQQMVYAVAMRTLEQFDRALGRIVYFRARRRLRLVPHAFRGANAFYHAGLRAVLFGWFRASEVSPGENLPGQTIFTCLSHDIIAHEVTHAVVDRLRPHFNVATNPHVRAFHEAFADIVAIFQRLTFRDLVQRGLQDARGDITRSSLLSDIAAQFGQGLGSGKALRTALDAKTRVQDVHEEHDLGAVLVSAVFEGFQTTYQRRCADLVRIATGGTGELPKGAIHPDLVARLTTECVRTAQSVLTMCVRAFDYLPPADVTFGAFLRALVTADWELNPLDESGLRASLIEACRRRGIFAADAGSLAVGALLLDTAPEQPWVAHKNEFCDWVDLVVRKGMEEQRKGATDDDNDPADRSSADAPEPDQEVDAGSKLRERIETWFEELDTAAREELGFDAKSIIEYPHFHHSLRTASDGTLRFGMVVQLVEVQTLEVDGERRKFPRGATLVIDGNGTLRFLVRAAASKDELVKLAEHGKLNLLGWPQERSDPFAVEYHGLHEGRTT